VFLWADLPSNGLMGMLRNDRGLNEFYGSPEGFICDSNLPPFGEREPFYPINSTRSVIYALWTDFGRNPVLHPLSCRTFSGKWFETILSLDRSPENPRNFFRQPDSWHAMRWWDPRPVFSGEWEPVVKDQVSLRDFQLRWFMSRRAVTTIAELNFHE